MPYGRKDNLVHDFRRIIVYHAKEDMAVGLCSEGPHIMADRKQKAHRTNGQALILKACPY